MMSASHHLASWCWVIVLPVPKPPGMAAVPPLAMGNMVSSTRWPVISGREMDRRREIGRSTRIGHFWQRVSSCSTPFLSWSLTTQSFTVYWPLVITAVTLPLSVGGTMQRCSMSGVSGQVA